MLLCRKHYLLRACAVSFVMFFLGYMLMSAAPNIWLLIPSTVVRSCGSSIVWVYSTLLIQVRVPNQLQGRMMALEMAFYVVSLCNNSSGERELLQSEGGVLWVSSYVML